MHLFGIDLNGTQVSHHLDDFLSLDKSATLFMLHLLEVESQNFFTLLAKEAK